MKAEPEGEDDRVIVRSMFKGDLPHEECRAQGAGRVQLTALEAKFPDNQLDLLVPGRGFLLLFLVCQNAAVLLVARPAFSPPGLLLTMQSSVGWAAARLFMNLRWLLPLAIALMVRRIVV